jgi:hypothetical protein
MKQTKFTARKRIMASASMLVISAVMLSTSTYAWFTMNKDVTVDGFQLTAKADSTYLIIGPESTVAGLQAKNRIDYSFSPVAALRVFPSAHKDALADTTSAAATSSVTTDAGTETIMTNWYYKYAEVPTASAAKATEPERTIADSVFATDYVLHRTVYVTLAEGSQAATNLRCTGATFTMTDDKSGSAETNNAVTVVVTSATAKDEEDVGSNFTLRNTVLATDVTDQTVIPLDIWIYYNGNDASVYTNNIKNLEGATLELTFTVDYDASMNNNP